MTLRTRVERLESGDGSIVVVRDCPACRQRIVSADLERFADAPDPCQHHRLAPPPGPGDIVIERSYARPLTGDL